MNKKFQVFLMVMVVLTAGCKAGISIPQVNAPVAQTLVIEEATVSLKPTTSNSQETAASGAVRPPAANAGVIDEMIKIPLIAIDDNGVSGLKIGCGDSVVMVDRPFTGPDALTQAYTYLLGIKQREYGESGLVDALYQSTLTIKKITVQDGTAFVYLEGSFMLSGECDNPRAQAQLEQTALQIPGIKSVQVFINDKTLAEALSLK